MPEKKMTITEKIQELYNNTMPLIKCRQDKRVLTYVCAELTKFVEKMSSQNEQAQTSTNISVEKENTNESCK